MTKYLPLLAIIFLVACNNSQNTSATNKDSAENKMNHDSMTKMNTAVPELPAVPAGAKVYFKNLKDGETVSSPVKVEMGVDSMKVEPIGQVVAGTGHFHIIIDAESHVPEGQMVPNDSTHLHFGKGQIETEVPLSPGKHKLTLQFADGVHRSYGSKMAATINVNVKK